MPYLYPLADDANWFAISANNAPAAAVALASYLKDEPPVATVDASLAYLVDGLDRAGLIGRHNWSYCEPERGLGSSRYEDGNVGPLRRVMVVMAPFVTSNTELRYEVADAHEGARLVVTDGELYHQHLEVVFKPYGSLFKVNTKGQLGPDPKPDTD